MLGKVKLFFGIEGLKVDLEIPETFSPSDTSVRGYVRLYSKSDQRMIKLEVKLIETYQRGRRHDKRINDYILGNIQLNDSIDIPAGGEKIIDFNIPFQLQYSTIEKLGQKSILHKQVSNLARWANNAKSEYFIEASTQVEGTALNPSVKKQIFLIKEP
jgi:sporulation-control protein spo0M